MVAGAGRPLEKKTELGSPGPQLLPLHYPNLSALWAGICWRRLHTSTCFLLTGGEIEIWRGAGSCEENGFGSEEQTGLASSQRKPLGLGQEGRAAQGRIGP